MEDEPDDFFFEVAHNVDLRMHRAAPGVGHPPGDYRFLLNLYNDANYANQEGLTHMHVACASGSVEAVEEYLNNGQNVNCVWRVTGDTPLHVALKYCKLDVARLLLSRGADPHLTNREGSTALHVVCKANSSEPENVDRFLRLLEVMRTPIQINAQDNLGNTPLHVAATYFSRPGVTHAMEALLRRGADPNVANNESSTPLHSICQRTFDDDDVLELFFQINDARGQPVVIHQRDFKDNTPLHYAVRQMKLRQSEILLRRGADPNLRNSIGWTCLHMTCARGGTFHVLLMLLRVSSELGRELLLDAQDHMSNTALHLFLRYGYHRAAKTLLRLGANPNLADAHGRTALHLLCRRKCIPCWLPTFFQMCQGAGKPAQLNPRDARGNTPLHVTLTKHHSVETQHLLAYGADPNLANHEGMSPLHVLCQAIDDRRCQCVEVFFSACAAAQRRVEIEARDGSGWTPLQWAVSSLLPRTCTELLDLGAKFEFPAERLLNQGLRERIATRNRLKMTSRAMVVYELLESRGYDLYRQDALALMDMFARHELFEMENRLERLTDDDYEKAAKEIQMAADVSLYDMLRAGPERASRLLSSEGFMKFAHTMPNPLDKLPERHREACDAHLREIMLQKFCREWTVDSFSQLTQPYVLTSECCAVLFDNLMCRDLYNICLAVTDEGDTDSENDVMVVDAPERDVPMYLAPPANVRARGSVRMN